MRILVLALYLIVTLSSLFADGVYFNHFDEKGGLPQINTMSIFQDEYGAMWFGTTEGLCRYNGRTTQVFNSSNTDGNLTQNIIYSIQGNNKGSIYLRANYDLVHYNIIANKFESVMQGNVTAIYYINDTLWFAYNNIIYQYVEDTKQTIEYARLGKTTRIISLHVTSNNEIWIGTQKGLEIISPNRKQADRQLFKDSEITTIFVDSKQLYWIGTTKQGVYLLDKNAQEIAHYKQTPTEPSLSNDRVRSIMQDSQGKMWIGTFGGLNCFDPITRLWGSYTQSEGKTSLSHSSIFSLYKDSQGTIWIGTYFGGVNYYNPESDVFKFYNANPTSKNHLSFPFVGTMTRDKHNNLWICTEGGGLNCLNLNTNKITSYLSNRDSGLQYNLKCIWYDDQTDRLYIGIHDKGLCVFDIKTKRVKILTHNPNLATSLPDNSVRALQYYDDALYVLTQKGLSKMNLDEERFYPPSNDPKIAKEINSNFIYSFHIDRKDRMWLSNWRMTQIDLKTKRIQKFIHSPSNLNSIGKFRANFIYETQKGELLFTSEGSGLFVYREETNDFAKIQSNIPYENKDIGEFCYHITETRAGRLILLSDKGVTIIDPQRDNKVLYKSSTKFPITRFFQGSSVYIAPNDKIFIGGTNGLVSVLESELINIKDKDFNLYLDKLYINDSYITPNDGTGILNTILSNQSKLKLKHNQNNLTIEFATSDYIQYRDRTYEYKLEGFDEEWTTINRRIITYKNINYGKYNLVVREKNKSVEKEPYKTRALEIEITPPFYKSTLAYIAYFIILAIILIAIYRFLIWRSELKASIKVERREKEHTEKLTQMKLRFFTNISHELRTPLTLIIGQIEMALKAKNTSEIQSRISKAYLNAEHMRKLISELLNFRKQEQGYNKLRVEKVELVGYLKKIYESFSEYAVQQQIEYSYIHPQNNIHLYVDTNQFEKAIYNLLSNAFKYTAKGGEIAIKVKDSNSIIYIEIEDNGIGIPQDSLSDVFERFYQVENCSSGFSLGTGIGLALTKEIIKAHQGNIQVDSTVNKGSVFTIELKKGHSHFSDSLITNVYSQTESSVNRVLCVDTKQTRAELNIEELLECKNMDENKNQKHTILIVEDNTEVLDFLADAFNKLYKVYTARDGKEGLQKTLDILPDIVLSDVMMPEMTGKEMCAKIKNNLNISHIPVVLLTAQDSQEQAIEGYMFGADAYVTKPFNIELLISRCNSIVKNRILLYQNLTQKENSIITFDVLDEEDKKLIDRVTQVVKDNFDNPDFDMNMLASELNLGRNKLYSKIKELTNLTPNEFTLSIKFNEALVLLDTHLHLNISEIAIYLGFSSTKYFSKCFKSFYGISPLQWRKDRHANKEETEE